MRPRHVSQEQLFYKFSLESLVPPDHLLLPTERFAPQRRNARKLVMP